jgi:hypothetical protein
MGFRTSSIVRILKNLEDKITTFRKLDLFSSSGEVRLALSKGPNRVVVSTHLRTETDPISETSCLYLIIL